MAGVARGRGWSWALALLSLLVATFAFAESSKLLKKYKGQLFVSDKAFEIVEDEAAMAAQVKQAKSTISASGANDEGATWTFSFMAVLNKKPGSSSATVFFIDAASKKQATYKDIGIDSQQLVILGDVAIGEEDGLTKGKTYNLELAVTQSGKKVVLAKGKASFK